jgi:hypothetical protein
MRIPRCLLTPLHRFKHHVTCSSQLFDHLFILSVCLQGAGAGGGSGGGAGARCCPGSQAAGAGGKAGEHRCIQMQFTLLTAQRERKRFMTIARLPPDTD